MPAKTFAHRTILLLAVVILSAPGTVRAQQTAAAQLAYDVVSIKPHAAGDGSMSFGTHDNSFQAKNVSLKQLLAGAYGIRDGLISGVPKWAEDARFDIEAKIVDPGAGLAHVTKEQEQARLASMLADRFQAKVHTETKTLPVYDLVVEKGGPKFKESGSQSPQEGPLKGLCAGCWMINNVGTSRMQQMDASAMPMSHLAEQLSSTLNRTVLDKTNLPGKYDLVLKWLPDDAALSAPADGSATDPGPSIFGALTEQLGLKLLPAKGPVVTLVVDRLEPPSPN